MLMIFREAREIYDAGAATATAIEIDITNRDWRHADSGCRTGIAALTRSSLLPQAHFTREFVLPVVATAKVLLPESAKIQSTRLVEIENR